MHQFRIDEVSNIIISYTNIINLLNIWESKTINKEKIHKSLDVFTVSIVKFLLR